MGKQRKNRPNATGRNPTSRFVALRHSLLSSNAYRSLSCAARALLVELVMLHNGENNGSLYLSVRDAAARLGLADNKAVKRAFNELVEMGFIACTAEGYFHVKAGEKSRARRWRLTFEAGPGRKGPTMDFEKREPAAQTPARNRMEKGQRALKVYRKARDAGKFAVEDCPPMGFPTAGPTLEPVEDFSPPKVSNGSFQPKCSVEDFSPHIATTMGSETNGAHLGWWQPDYSSPMGHLAFFASLAAHRQNVTALKPAMHG